jgi:hypothetical protein
MKLAIAAFASLLLLGSLPARAGDLEDKRDAKLKKDFLKKVDWVTDYDKAREEAKKSGKMIFGYFTRSYAT